MRLLQISFLFAFVGTSFSLDKNIFQLDLVFPKDNGVYKPIYPFPIVFALHNLDIVWPYQARLVYNLDQDPKLAISSVKDRYLYGWETYSNPPGYQNALPATSPFLLINSTDSLLNRVGQFTLAYRFSLGRNCSTFNSEYEANHANGIDGGSFYFHGSINFEIDAERGQMVDISSGDSCSQPLGTVGIEKGAGKYANESNTICDVSATSPPPPTESCAFTVNPNTSNQVKDAMIQASGCEGTTWPNSSLLAHCGLSPSQKSEALKASNIIFLNNAVFIGVLGIFVFAMG